MSAIPRNSFDTLLAPVAAKSASLLNTAVFSIVKRLSGVRNFWSYRRTMTQLATLDDHMLKDIGITRSDISRPVPMLSSEGPNTRLRFLTMERRACDTVWTRTATDHQRLHVQRPRPSGCESYRSGDQRNQKHG